MKRAIFSLLLTFFALYTYAQGTLLDPYQLQQKGATTNQILQWNGTFWGPSTISLSSSAVTGVLPAANGGTGVNNGSNTLTLGGSVTFSGAFATTFTTTGATSVTLPTSGTLTTGSGVSGQIPYWAGTNSLTGSTSLTWDNTNGILTTNNQVVNGYQTVGTNTQFSGANMTVKGQGSLSTTYSIYSTNGSGTPYFWVNDAGTVYAASLKINSTNAVTITNTSLSNATTFTIGNGTANVIVGNAAGGVTIGGSTGSVTISNTSTSTADILINTANPNKAVVIGSSSIGPSTGAAKQGLKVGYIWNPSSGSIGYTAYQNTTSFQSSGTASGTIRGFLDNPTVIGFASSPYRSFESRVNSSTAKGFAQIGSSTQNFFQGSTIIGDTISASAILHVKGASNTTTLQRWDNSTTAADLFVSSASPASVITASAGDLTIVDDGTNGYLYQKWSGNATSAGWSKLLNVSDALGATTGQYLKWSGTAWVPSTVTGGGNGIYGGSGSLPGDITVTGGSHTLQWNATQFITPNDFSFITPPNGDGFRVGFNFDTWVNPAVGTLTPTGDGDFTLWADKGTGTDKAFLTMQGDQPASRLGYFDGAGNYCYVGGDPTGLNITSTGQHIYIARTDTTTLMLTTYPPTSSGLKQWNGWHTPTIAGNYFGARSYGSTRFMVDGKFTDAGVYSTQVRYRDNMVRFDATNLATLSTSFLQLNGTGVGINTIPVASTALDIASTTQGVRFSPMTTTNRTSISTPAEGLLVYDNTAHSYYQFNGTSWTSLGGSSTPPAGSNTQVQYNDSGSFGASSVFTFNGTGITLTQTNDQSPYSINLSGNGTAGLTWSRDSRSSEPKVVNFNLGRGYFPAVSTAGDNQVYYLGLNVAPGGGLENSAAGAAMYLAFENNYRNSSGEAKSFEFHVPHVQYSTGAGRRPITMFLSNDPSDIRGNVGFCADYFSILDYKTNSQKVIWNFATNTGYNKGITFSDTASLYFAKNNAYALQQRNAANSAYIGLIKADGSDRILLGGQAEARIALYNEVQITNGGKLWNENGVIAIGNSTNPSALTVYGGSATYAVDVTGAIRGSSDLYLGSQFKIYDTGSPLFHQTGTYNVYLGINSGNLTTTSQNNVGIGRLTLNSVTTGGGNSAIGDQALRALTTGNSNFALGADALKALTTGNYNVAIGPASLNTAVSASENVAIGLNAGNYITSNTNVAIGFQALEHNAAQQTTAIGGSAGQLGTNKVQSVLLGAYAGYSNTASSMIDIGYFAGANASSDNSVHIGYGAGYDNTTSNEFVVDWNGGLTSNHSTPLIYGKFNTGRIAINKVNPTVTFEIGGTDAMLVPSGTTGQEPTGAVGYLRYNSTTGTYRGVVSGSTWVDFLTTASSVPFNRLSGATATNTLDNTNYSQTWNWSTMTNGNCLIMNANSLTIGTGMIINSNSLTSGVLLSVAQTNNSYNGNGVVKVQNNSTSTSGTVFYVQANNSNADNGFWFNANNQFSVGNASPNASAIVEFKSTTKGFLPPRMTNAQLTAITSPATGLLAYQTDGTAGYYYYNGTSWTGFGGGGGIPAGLNGSVQYKSGSSFAGTADLFFDSSTGRLGINRGVLGGTAAFPNASLNVHSAPGETTVFEVDNQGDYPIYTILDDGTFQIGSGGIVQTITRRAEDSPAITAGGIYYQGVLDSIRGVDGFTIGNSYNDLTYGYFSTARVQANFAPGTPGSTSNFNILKVDGSIDGTYTSGQINGILIQPVMTTVNTWKALNIGTNIGYGVYQSGSSSKNWFAGTTTIGANTSIPSAALAINSTTQGFLVPRMTNAQITGISSPATGLLAYQTDGSPGFYYYNGSAWTTLAGGGGGSPSLSSLTAATGTNTINNAGNQQIWQWNSLTTSTGLALTSNSLTAGSVAQVASSNNSLNTSVGIFRVDNLGTSTSGSVFRVSANSNLSNAALNVRANGNVGIGTDAPSAALHVGGTPTIANGGTNGMLTYFDGSGLTDNTTATSGTVAHTVVNGFGVPNLYASNTGVTYTNASTVYIAGPPVAGTNVTITNPYSLYSAKGRWYATDVTSNTNTSTYSVASFSITSSGTPSTSFGYRLSFKGQSSTTVDRDMGYISPMWETATDASRSSSLSFGIWTNTAANLVTAMKIGPGSVAIYSSTGSNPVTITNTSLTFAGSYTIGNVNLPLTLGGTSQTQAISIQSAQSGDGAVQLVASGASGSMWLSGGGAATTRTGISLNVSGRNGLQRTGTTGTQNEIEALSGFAPTSGTAVWGGLVLVPTLNQTGGANGISRIFYINPTITAAADCRAIEINMGSTSHKGFVQTGTSAINYNEGLTGFGSSTTPTTAVDVTSGSLRTRGLTLQDYNNITGTGTVTGSTTIEDNLINPGSNQSTLTVNLPASPVDKQICRLTFAYAVTTLTVSGNGTTVKGTLPTTASVGQGFIFKYYSSATSWVRIQ